MGPTERREVGVSGAITPRAHQSRATGLHGSRLFMWTRDKTPEHSSSKVQQVTHATPKRPKKKMVQTNILQLLFLAKFTFATITTSISASSMASFNPRFDFSGVDLVLYRGSYSIYADGSIVSTNVAADARVDAVFGNWKNVCPLKGQVGYETRSVRCKYPGIGIMYVFTFALLINMGGILQTSES